MVFIQKINDKNRFFYFEGANAPTYSFQSSKEFSTSRIVVLVFFLLPYDVSLLLFQRFCRYFPHYKAILSQNSTISTRNKTNRNHSKKATLP